MNWSQFETISEWDPWFGSEYENGLISPSNVVFNPYGNNAAISRDTPFNLISAYLTGGIDVEVEGYISNSLAYDRTFALNEDTPTLVTFDFWGVTQVAFVPEPMTPFAMDNLTVSAPDFTQLPPPSASSPPTNGNSIINLGHVVVPSIDHQFVNFIMDPPTPERGAREVRDALVDSSSGSSAVLPTVTANFDTNNGFEITLAAPTGQQFVVRPSAGQGFTFDADLEWTALEAGSGDWGPATVSFAGLQGTPPDFAPQQAILAARHEFFGFNDIQSVASTNGFSFTSVTFTAMVPSLDIGAGAMTYTPSSGAVVFMYDTQGTNDPGRTMSLAPLTPPPPPPPLVEILREPNGDITLIFSGTLQWTADLGQGFVDVPGNPQGRYTLPKAALDSGRQFRARR